MSVVPCPCCGKPLHEFESRTDSNGSAVAVRVLVYVHSDLSRCQVRVPLTEAEPRAPRQRPPTG